MDKIKTMLISLKNVTPATWVRLIFLVASVINIALKLFSANSAESNELAENVTSVIVLIISSAAAYWKNNSFTEAAQAADAILAALKRSK